jgi:hypothetical protein
MNIICKSGDFAYLIELADRAGVVLDITSEPTLSQVASIDTLLTSGPWQPFEGDSERIRELVYRIASEGVELAAVGFDVKSPARRLPNTKVEPDDLRLPLVKVLSPGIQPGFDAEGTFVFGKNRMARHPDTTVVR